MTNLMMKSVLIVIRFILVQILHLSSAQKAFQGSLVEYFRSSSATTNNLDVVSNKAKNSRTVENSLLADLVRHGAVSLKADVIQQRDVVDVRREEVYSHLIQNGGLQTDFTKPSVGFMLKVFENLLDGEGLDKAVGHTDGQTQNEVLYADTIRSFTAKKYRDKHAVVRLPPLPKHERVVMAEMRFLGNQNVNRRQRFVLQVRKDRKTIEKFKAKSKRNGFINLPEKLVAYINSFHGNVSIVLRQKPYRRKSSVPSNAPILVIYSSDDGFMKSVYNSYTSEETQSHRSKRATNTLTKKEIRRRRKNKWTSKEQKPCQLYNFRVDFDLIGWGPWIVHPKNFNAHVCYGSCPSPVGHEYSPTNHAMLQSLMKMKRPRSAPAPCCVPTKLRPLSMLYFEYDDIVVRHHEDMIASECGCR